MRLSAFCAVIDLSIASGESVALTGESGSGKSTLLHLIAGLDRADGGEMWLDDTFLSGLTDSQFANIRRTGIGLIFQQFNLIPSLNVADNLSFQARIADRFDAAWREELAARLGIEDVLQRIPNNCPAVSSSALPSAGRWRSSPGCFSPTSPPAISTRQPQIMCFASCSIWSGTPDAVW